MGHVISGIGHFIGREFSLKNLVPEVLTLVGGAVGTAILPGVGTAIGAGLGDFAGNEIEGKKLSTSLEEGAIAGASEGIGEYVGGSGIEGAVIGGGLSGFGNSELQGNSFGESLGSGLESGALAYGAGEVEQGVGSSFGLGSGSDATGAGAAGSDGLDAGSAATIGSGSGTLVGNAINSAGSDLGLAGAGGGTTIGNAINSGWSSLTGGTATTAATRDTASINAHGAFGATAAAPAVDPALASAAASGAGSEAGGFLSKGSLLKDAVAATPVLLAAIRGNQQPTGESEISATAASLDAQGIENASYLQSGQLPPGAQAAINQAVSSSEASIRSQYASMGGSGSSAEAQDIENAKQQGVIQASNLATQLLSTGIQEQEASADLYTQIMNQSMQQDQALSSAIGNFAAAAVGAGGQPSVTAGNQNGFSVSLAA